MLVEDLLKYAITILQKDIKNSYGNNQNICSETENGIWGNNAIIVLEKIIDINKRVPLLKDRDDNIRREQKHIKRSNNKWLKEIMRRKMTRDELYEQFYNEILRNKFYTHEEIDKIDRDDKSNNKDEYIEYLEDQLLNIYNNMEDDGK